MDTKYQRAKIIVEETKQFYCQFLFSIGLFIFILIRFQFSQSFNLNQTIMNIGNASPPAEIAFFQTNTFIFLYIGTIFSLFLIYKYIKLYRIKRKFRNTKQADNFLKKYMKTDDLPTIEKIHEKFDEDKKKEKKRFYFLVVRVAIINIVLCILSTYFPLFSFFDIILAFSIINLIYRHLFIFHADKKLFNDKWENKKVTEYTKSFNEF
ncbi:hypothetical protein MBCUT_12430 [Methanobrevibacter cuticularis]|uniref:2TM domain-containing protein n=1 Tax=Methanobrevibacter cuticularis TaxID=47311 RepID=A0A166DR00_9EURY|nr:2TM domain-containing protein [Methanobrevibacter cuticularis]KZX15865.1 hypothetical protein MBCUT_12430 [Methanobrevibacter cuticularis]